MRLAIPSLGKDLDSVAIPTLGRAPYILIIEINNDKVEIVDTIENIFYGRGIGMLLFNTLLSRNVEGIVMGGFGRIYNMAVSSGIKVYPLLTTMKVKDIIEKIKKKELSPLTQVSAWKPWGKGFGRRMGWMYW